MNPFAELQMFQVCDSLFPIGAFTLSNGLETYVHQGKLTCEEELEAYINSMLQILPYQEIGTMLLAYHHSEDWDYLMELDHYVNALKAPMEVRNGAKKLCSRFLKIWEKIKNYDSLSYYQELVKKKKCEGSHGIAMGLFAKEISLEAKRGASIYLYSLLTAMVTNGVKTIPLSQVSGQRILHGAIEKISACVEKADKISIEDLGVGGAAFDIMAMNHETLYSRLYMS